MHLGLAIYFMCDLYGEIHIVYHELCAIGKGIWGNKGNVPAEKHKNHKLSRFLLKKNSNPGIFFLSHTSYFQFISMTASFKRQNAVGVYFFTCFFLLPP